MAAFMKLTRGRLILIAVVVTLFGAYTLFGFFGVPRLLRSNATEFVADTYGRKLDLGEIRFNPFTLVLRIQDLSFPDAEGAPLVGLRCICSSISTPRRCSAWRRASRPSSSISPSRVSSSARTAR